MFRFDMHMLKSHSHYTRNLHNWHQEGKRRKKKKKEKKKNAPPPQKSQRINVSIVTQKITDEVKLQVQ